MRILTLMAPVFGTRCTLLVADDGACVVVDPGGGAAPLVARAVADHGLRVVGVLATHGHPDHVWDAAAVADAAGVPLRLHIADAAAATDPLQALSDGLDPASAAVGGALAEALRSAGCDPSAYAAPTIAPFGEVEPVGGRSADVVLDLDGIRVVARHAPGHTPGSTLYLVEAAGETVVLSGDVLFAGGVGRTDLPGGDPAAMRRTLREVVRALPAGAHVLPGHGPTTRTDVELSSNPYLAG